MDNWMNWLAGTYWYVPEAYLPAVQFDPDTGQVVPLLDQTVWFFTGTRDGYVWGKCYAMLTAEDGSVTYSPARYVVGSITPWDAVQFRFVQEGRLAASPTSVTGFGNFVPQGEGGIFQMQMVSGLNDVTVHWAEMWQTKEGDASWSSLPGTGGQSMEDYLGNF